MTISRDELEKAVGAAVASALFEHNRIIERRDAKIGEPQPVNWKHLLTTIAGATILGLTAWVLTTSNRVSLLENNMDRMTTDMGSVNTNVGKILDSIRTIEGTRFTATDWETRAAPMISRLKIVEDGEARQWDQLRQSQVAVEKLKFDVEALKDVLTKMEMRK